MNYLQKTAGVYCIPLETHHRSWTFSSLLFNNSQERKITH